MREANVAISGQYTVLANGFDYTIHVRGNEAFDHDEVIVFTLGERFIKECVRLGIDPIDATRKITEVIKKTVELEEQELPLGAEVRAEADTELEAIEARDKADDDLRDQWDTLGGAPPDDQRDRSEPSTEDE